MIDVKANVSIEKDKIAQTVEFKGDLGTILTELAVLIDALARDLYDSSIQVQHILEATGDSPLEFLMANLHLYQEYGAGFCTGSKKEEE